MPAGKSGQAVGSTSSSESEIEAADLRANTN